MTLRSFEFLNHVITVQYSRFSRLGEQAHVRAFLEQQQFNEPKTLETRTDNLKNNEISINRTISVVRNTPIDFPNYIESMPTKRALWRDCVEGEIRSLEIHEFGELIPQAHHCD